MTLPKAILWIQHVHLARGTSIVASHVPREDSATIALGHVIVFDHYSNLIFIKKKKRIAINSLDFNTLILYFEINIINHMLEIQYANLVRSK